MYVRSPPRFLLLLRVPLRGAFWQPVTGGVEPWDRSLADAMLREVAEETGFRDVAAPEAIGWSLIFPGPTGLPIRSYSFGLEAPMLRAPKLSGEHDAYRWCTTAEALGTLHWPDNREGLRRLLQRLRL